MKWAIMGGGNPHGLNLARHLLSMGEEVIGIGRSSLKGKAFTLGVEEMGYRYWVYSIGPDTEFIMDLLEKEQPKVIVSFAAQGEGAASFKPAKHRKVFYMTNACALIDFAEEVSERLSVERFIQIGTSELYGSVEKAADESAPTKPTSPYANSKLTFDNHLAIMHAQDSFPCNVIRPSNAYCPGQQLHRVIPRAIISALSGKKLQLQGGGKAQKSYIHTTDLAKAIVACVERGKLGSIYNVGPLAPISIKALVTACAEAAGVSFEELVEEVPGRQGEDGKYHLDSTAIARDCGWTQTIGLGQGLRGMVEWVKSYPELLEMDYAYRLRA